MDTYFNTPIGIIIGQKENGLIRATGIPYANAERYQKPFALSPFVSPFRAASWSNAALQISSPVMEDVLGIDILERTPMSEDCQQLSITIPDTLPNSKLPVMVWIYGGSYTSGAGDSPVYDPKLMVLEQKVIVVNINFRLGLFGFLGGYDNRSANLGLLDIICALKWIQQNIEAFGGNPQNVTLFGQSAGGDAIAHLLISDGVEGLFQNAIIQSAPLGIRKNRTKMTQKMIEMAKAIPENADIPQILAQQGRINLAMQKMGLKGGMPFGVQYGHAPLPKEEDTENLWKQSAPRFNILIGYTEEETSLFMPFVKIVQWMGKIPFLGKYIIKIIVKITTDIIYRKPAIKFAKSVANKESNTFLYSLSWHAPNKFGATHTVDIPLLFGEEDTWENAALLQGKNWKQLYEDGQKIRKIWATFARTGKLKSTIEIPNVISCRQVF